MYVQTKYKFEVIDERLNISTKDSETITIKLIIKDTRPIYVTNVYRPSSGMLDNFITHLYDLLQYMDMSNKCERIVGGDFNINFMTNNIQTRELKKLIAKKLSVRLLRRQLVLLHNKQ